VKGLEVRLITRRRFFTGLASLVVALHLPGARRLENYVRITGTTTITSFDTKAGERFLYFTGAKTLTYDSTNLRSP
jgi:hypothetical protein